MGARRQGVPSGFLVCHNSALYRRLGGGRHKHRNGRGHGQGVYPSTGNSRLRHIPCQNMLDLRTTNTRSTTQSGRSFGGLAENPCVHW
eukprot:2651308-Prorocentrum_lima.AAC.1